MNAVFAWVMGIISNIRNWWNNNHQQVRQDLRQAFQRIDSFFDRLSRGVLRMMAIAIALKVASYFCPELPARIPVIYGWCDGFLQLGEFGLRAALGGLYAFFTGNWSSFWAECNSAFHELLQQFNNWLSCIRF